MKRFYRVLMALALLSCQVSPQGISLSRKGDPQHPAVLSQHPHGLITIAPEPQTGRYQLAFKAHYPQSNFRTQALDCNSISRIKVSVSGIGMAAPLYANGADVNQTVAGTGCDVTATVSGVPSGESRIGTVIAYDNTQTEISGSTLKAVFHVVPPTTNVQLSYKNTPAGIIMEQIIAAKPILGTQLNLTQLQTLIDTLTGVTGAYPNFNYTLNPALINNPAIAADLLANGGKPDQLNPANPAYVLQGGTVSGQLQGLVSTDKATIRITDPASGLLVNQTNGAFNAANIPAGTWKMIVIPPTGYTVTGVPAALNVTAGGTLNVGTITLTPATPTIAGFSATGAAVGEEITINGTNFHANADGNVITVGGVTVPTADITVISATQLKIKVPAGTALGLQNVTVAVGTQNSNTQALTITPLAAPTGLATPTLDYTSFNLTWNAVPTATSYKVFKDGVLQGTVAAPTTNLNLIGLTANTTYAMTVVATNALGDSAPSATLNVTTTSNWASLNNGAMTGTTVVTDIQIKPTQAAHLYVATSGAGVLRTTDSGTNWTAVNTGLTNLNVTSLALDPTNTAIVYAGTTGGGIFKTVDSGDNWMAVNTGVTNLNVLSLAIDPVTPAIVYAGTNGGGIFKTTNGGTNWTASNTGLTNLNIHALTVTPGTPSRIYAGTQGGGPFKSNDSGANWALITNGLPGIFLGPITVTDLVVDPATSILYGSATGLVFIPFCFRDPGIWRRNDSLVPPASDWSNVGGNGICTAPNTGLTNAQVLDLAMDPSNTNRVYAATQNGIFRSQNGLGTAWAAMSMGLGNMNVRVLAIDPANSNRIYAGTNGGIYRVN